MSSNEFVSSGWVCLWRDLIDKPIWKCSTPEQNRILITLLCMANHKPKRWEFGGELYEVQAVQFITSLPSIVEKCACKDITVQKVRTALKRFEKLGFLTDKSTNKNRLITIVNWEKYQEKGYFLTDDLTGSQQADNRQLTGNQQATNRQITANNNDNNINNDNNDNNDNNLSILSAPETPYSTSPTPQREDRIDTIDTMFINQLKFNIGYEDLLVTCEKSEVDNIINLAYDLISVSGETIRIGDKVFTKDYIRDILLSLNSSKIEFLTIKLRDFGMDGNIRNPKRYMQSCIVNTAMNYDTEWQEYFNRTYYGAIGGD